MSGGFFRGTSADQDTRFSNKQAKLLKTQKFAPELDHMVDMTRVKMDVMRPWIATRVTELLGFEDEVLINFIYGLLDGKEVDGKQIQIQLTGFMEKNTVKFMKELWGLLLSAQQNASGVPQQFLDAKEAEIQQRKAEDARIAQEIQNKREKDGRDIEIEKPRRMDGDAGNSRFDGVTLGSASDNVNAEEEQSKHSSRTKNREGRRSRSISLSPHAGRRSLSPRRRSPSPSRHSHSSERRHRSSRRSISPRKRSVSPQRHSPRSTPSMSRRRSPYSRRRSPSVTRYRSPSPRRRSPHTRRKSPYFVRRRSPSPYRRWSPAHASRRSPFPPRRRSPVRRRPSPARHCSPSPGRRRPRSPVRRRSQSPYHQPQSRSPKRRRRSPHSPRSRAANRRLSPRRRSVSPYNSSSPSSPRRSLSRDFDRGTNGVPSNKDRDVLRRNQEISHDDDMNDTEITGHPNEKHNYLDTKSHRLTKSLRSPQHEARDQKAINNKRHSGYSLVQPDSPSVQRDSTQNSPVKSSGKHLPSQDSMDTSGDEEEGIRARENARKANSSRRKTKDSSTDLQLKKVRADDSSPGEKSPLRSARRYTKAIGGHPGNPGASREREQQSGKDFPKKHDGRLLESSSEEERDGRKMKRQTDSPDDSCVKQRSPRRVAKDDTYSKDRINNEHGEKSLRDAAYDATTGNKHSAEVDKLSQSDDEASPVRKIKNRTDGNTYMDSGSSGSEDPEKYRSHVERRRHRKSHKHRKHHDDSSESDSEPNDKESRKRRKEEKKLRKEEKRRRREERHRRRSERHASKQKLKHIDTVTPPSDLDKDHESDSDDAVRKEGSSRGGREDESEQKKLEIELREKALESLRAKKAINH